MTETLSLKKIVQTWWPLAASWLLMAVELPALAAVMARLPDEKIHLAAYGGVVFPISLIVEAPIIMLLAASTALSKDWESYRWLRSFMLWVGGAFTLLHFLIAVIPPLYDWVVIDLIGAPEEIIEPARIGLLLMTPWTGSIAYRRFQQGALIRFGYSRAVGVGTAIRLCADLIVLGIGLYVGTIPGIVVATCAVSAGVITEAVYAGLRIRPVVRNEIKHAPPVSEPLELWSFLQFYLPLVMTSFLTMLFQPIGSAALSRLPQPLESLAVWPVVAGLVFMFRSAGVAYNEVVVALLDEPGAAAQLRRFALIMAGGMTALILLLTVTPLSPFWFGTVSALKPELTQIARISLWFFLPMPALSVIQSWYQGVILNSKRTRAITEAIALFLVAAIVILQVAIRLDAPYTGLYVGAVAFTAGTLAQTGWLWWRSRPVLRRILPAMEGVG